MESKSKKKVIIIGAGPAGLTAGIELLKNGSLAVELLERDTVVGGLAKTTDYKGCKYDIGPHHFITEDARVQAWWEELMQDDFIKHKRFTRIYYNNHFFHYPLEPMNVLQGLSLLDCMRSVLSYIRYRIAPVAPVTSFQDWVTNKFGYHLFSIFFKTYTEKVWGISCDQISADWAAQRIKGFSLSKAIFYAFFGHWFKKNAPRTINDAFYYPSLGAGTLWEKVAEKITGYDDGSLFLNQEVVLLEHDHKVITAVVTQDSSIKGIGAKKLTRHACDYLLSTMPLQKLVLSLLPQAPEEVITAAQALSYRGLITVNLIINKKEVCPDHWLYVHEKKVRMGRVGNMNNFSLSMSDSPDHTALSLEYFAFHDEPFWHKSDQELIKLAGKELQSIGLIEHEEEVLDGMVMRTAEAYPVYDRHYKEHLDTVLDYLATFKNLHLMGRNGLHRYNNMDIAMLSAFAVVEKIEQEAEKIQPFKQNKKTRMTVNL